MFKVYFSLLDSGGSSEENEEILMDTLDTLLQFSNYTNPVKILEAVPESFSVEAMSTYLRKIMPMNTHKYRQQTIQKNLYRMRKLQVQDELFNLQKMCYVIKKGTSTHVTWYFHILSFKDVGSVGSDFKSILNFFQKPLAC